MPIRIKKSRISGLIFVICLGLALGSWLFHTQTAFQITIQEDIAPEVVVPLHINEWLSEMYECKTVYFEFEVCDKDDFRLEGSIDFGDGNTKQLQNITCARFRIPHVYEKAGTFSVTLKLCDPDGKCIPEQTISVDIKELVVKQSMIRKGTSGTKCSDIYYQYNHPLPVAISCSCNPQNIVKNEEKTTCKANFQNLGNANVKSVNWDLNGDGNFDDGSGQSVTTSFSSPGLHLLSAKAEYDGKSALANCSVYVYDRVKAEIKCSPTEVSAGEEVDCGASLSSGNITSYSWNPDPDQGQDTDTVKYSFKEPGNYEITVTVTDSAGNKDSASQKITVKTASSRLKAVITCNSDNPKVGQELTCKGDDSEHQDSTIVEYHWVLKDSLGKTLVDTTSPFSYTFSSEGSYRLSLAIRDDKGQTDTTQKDIIVSASENQSPTADFVYSPENPQKGREITFDASSSFDQDGEINKYSWDFGDGETATGEVTQHSYSQAGEYEVKLTVTDDQGEKGTKTEKISVSEPTRTYQIIVDSAPEGIAGYTLIFSVSEPAKIKEARTIAFSGVPPSFQFLAQRTKVQITTWDNGDAVKPGAENIILAEVDVENYKDAKPEIECIQFNYDGSDTNMCGSTNIKITVKK